MIQPETRTAKKSLLRLSVVMNRTGLGRSTIYALIQQGVFPAPVRISNRAVAWSEDAVEAWITSRPTILISRNGPVGVG